MLAVLLNAGGSTTRADDPSPDEQILRSWLQTVDDIGPAVRQRILWHRAEDLFEQQRTSAGIETLQEYVAALRQHDRPASEMRAAQRLLAGALELADQLDEAIVLRTELLDQARAMFGVDDWRTLDARFELQTAQTLQRQPAEVRAKLLTTNVAADVSEFSFLSSSDEESPQDMVSGDGNPEEAPAVLKLALLRDVFGAQHPAVLREEAGQLEMAFSQTLYGENGREAAGQLTPRDQDHIARLIAAYGQPHPHVAEARRAAARRLMDLQRHDEAATQLEASVAELERLAEVPQEFAGLALLPDQIQQVREAQREAGQFGVNDLDEVRVRCIRALSGDGSPQAREAELELSLSQKYANLTAEQFPRAQQASQDLDESDELASEQRFDEARAALERGVAVFNELLNNHPSIAIRRHLRLTNWAYASTDAVAAVRAHQNYLTVIRDSYGPTHPRVTEQLGQIAEFAEGRADALVTRRIKEFAPAGDPLPAEVDPPTAEKTVPEFETLSAAAGTLEEVRHLCIDLQGVDHWRTTNLGLQLDMVRRLEKLEDDQWRELAQAGALLEHIDAFALASRRELSRVQAAKSTYDRLLGPSSRQSINTGFLLAQMYLVKGDDDRAFALCHEMRRVIETSRGPQHPQFVSLLEGVAGIYNGLGEYAHSQEVSYRAQAVRSLIPDLPMRYEQVYTSATVFMNVDHELTDAGVRRLHELALRQLAAGDFKSAVESAQDTLRAIESLVGTSHVDYAAGLAHLARVSGEFGDIVTGVDRSREALALLSKIGAEQTPQAAGVRANLAILYERSGQNEEARQELEAVRSLQETFEATPVERGHTLSNLGFLYHKLGLRDEAEHALRAAVELLRSAQTSRQENLDAQAAPMDQDILPAALSHLGILYVATGRADAAEPLLEEALRLREAAGHQHWTYAEALHDLAVLADGRGAAEEAIQRMQEALAISQANLERAIATQSERQQVGMAQMLRRRLDLWLSITTRSHLAVQSVYAEALLWKGAVQARHVARLHHLEDSELQELISALWYNAQSLASLRWRVSPQSDDSTIHVDRPETSWEDELARIDAQREELEQQLAARIATLQQGEAVEATAVESLVSHLPEGAVLVDFYEYRHAPAGVDASLLGPESTRLTAFVVSTTRPVQRIDLGPAALVEEAVRDWHASRMTVDLGPDSPGQRLRRMVWVPLSKALAPEDQLVISPVGALTTFPFAAMPVSEDRYLIEDRPVALFPVPRMLATWLSRPSLPAEEEDKPPSLLLVGDVDFNTGLSLADAGRAASSPITTDDAGRAAAFGQSFLSEWPRLVGTRSEILQIRDTFEEAFADGRLELRRSAAPTETFLREALPAYRWVHLATHGFFADPQQALPRGLQTAAAEDGSRRVAPEIWSQVLDRWHPGLLSGIVLAGANQVGSPYLDDGVLTALEVADMNLGQVDCVVLSACDTGRGRAEFGEGVVSLQRAFHFAGVPTVVATLWKIDDQRTAALMGDFYSLTWSAGHTRLRALQQAQLNMMRRNERGAQAPGERGGRLPPHDWAGFTLSGDWRQ